MRLIYSFLFYFIQPAIWLRLLWRSRTSPHYRQRILERYGFCEGKVKQRGILIHAVSVGETMASIGLIKSLQRRYPEFPITVTTMTPTGSEQVKSLLGSSVSHVYLPYDMPGSINRFLNFIQPKLVIIMETELWPNLIFELNKRNIPLIIANARLSERSATRYAKLGRFIENLLSKITHIAVQNQQDAKRFAELGITQQHMTVTGSIKFDITLTIEQQNKIDTLKNRLLTPRPIFIAASTHKGEDEIIIEAFKRTQKKYPNLLLILVPRHPERFKLVEQILINSHIRYQLRSADVNPSEQTEVILVDTMGELIELYGLADIAFVGGSLVSKGGHNPLEPALHHIPIIMGEHFFNFNVICQQLIAENGLLVSQHNGSDLDTILCDLLQNQAVAKQIGENAYRVLKKNQGALNRLLTILDKYLDNDMNKIDSSRKEGILLINLGTPSDYSPSAIKSYLAEFLHDRHVVDLNPLLWYPILHGIVLPKRAPYISKHYQKIWIKGKSPLLHYSQLLKNKLQDALPDTMIELAMTYGQPSIKESIEKLKLCDKITILPMFPQYSTTTTEAVIDKFKALVPKNFMSKQVNYIHNYAGHPQYIDALCQQIKQAFIKHGMPEHLILSYHGIPLRYIKKRADIYSAQCELTTELLINKLRNENIDVPISMTYQSKFGKGDWTEPNTSDYLKKLATDGVKHVHVICPGFAVDCIETIYEINEENRDIYQAAGGEKFFYIPSLNDDQLHVELLISFIHEQAMETNLIKIEAVF